MNTDSEAYFKRWVKAPIEKLRTLPDGDGAFAALSICCGLFERFIDSQLSKDQMKATPEAFRELAAKILGCDLEAFRRFWDGFRLGMQHAFQPKAYIQNKGLGDRWGWQIAEADGFHHYPVIVKTSDHSYVVIIDPWKFSEFVINKWESCPDMLNQLSEFMFGEITPLPQTKPVIRADTSKLLYCDESSATGIWHGTGQ